MAVTHRKRRRAAQIRRWIEHKEKKERQRIAHEEFVQKHEDIEFSGPAPEITVACVLKTGGDFNAVHVRRLRDQVAANMTIPYQFRCLTDDPMNVAMLAGVVTTRLVRDLPGWWSKLELFDHDMGHVIYFDLDTAIRSNIDFMAKTGDGSFWMMANLPDTPPLSGGSGIMCWTGPRPWIGEDFTVDQIPQWSSINDRRWGDQGWIWNKVKDIDGRILDLAFPDQFASYKAHIKAGKRLDAPVVYFHGYPRPWHVGW